MPTSAAAPPPALPNPTPPPAHFQMLGQPLPNGAGFHVSLSKEANPGFSPGEVIGDELVCFQLGCHFWWQPGAEAHDITGECDGAVSSPFCLVQSSTCCSCAPGCSRWKVLTDLLALSIGQSHATCIEDPCGGLPLAYCGMLC